MTANSPNVLRVGTDCIAFCASSAERIRNALCSVTEHKPGLIFLTGKRRPDCARQPCRERCRARDCDERRGVEGVSVRHVKP